MDDVTRTEYRIEADALSEDDYIYLPEYIVDRTVNILSYYPMTNQNIILDLACWWFDNAGNCAIYQWCIHHLDHLENGDKHDSSLRSLDLHDEAKEQVKAIGFYTLVEEKIDEQRNERRAESA